MSKSKIYTVGILVFLAIATLVMHPMSLGAQVYSPDDDFSSTTLDSKWRVPSGSGSLGTVDPFATNVATPVYDLVSKSGYLAVQADNGTFAARQDYTLPDGKSVILTLAPAINVSSNLADEVVAGITLNNGDNNPVERSGNGYTSIQFRAINDAWEIQGLTKDVNGTVLDESLVGGGVDDEYAFNGMKMQFKISRKDNNGSPEYMLSYSFGGVFVPIKRMQTSNNAYSNIWIRVASYQDYTNGRIVPIQLFDDIKVVDNTEI